MKRKCAFEYIMEIQNTSTEVSAEQYVRRNVYEYVHHNPIHEVQPGFLRLHANESPFNSPENRYPDASLSKLKAQWGRHEGIPPQCCYLCNGTEEAFDLSLRIFCKPSEDAIIIPSPSRSIYKRRALLTEVPYVEVPLKPDTFALDADAILERMHSCTKMIVLCNPNSPTGNCIAVDDIATLAELFSGIVLVDESYIEFSPNFSSVELLNRFSNIIILRSFSHAWASASVRLSVVVAHPALIKYFNRMGMGHPISRLASDYAEKLISRRLDVDKWVRQLIDEREKVAAALVALPVCEKVYPSGTNFLMVRFKQCNRVLKHLNENHIAVADCQNHGVLKDCVRITIALPSQNSVLLGALRRYCEKYKLS